MKTIAVSLQTIGLISLGLTGSASAASGIFGTGVVLEVNGAKTLYTTTLLNDSRHQPINISSPSITHGLPANLGTFDTSSGNTLVLMGAGILTYKNGPDDITGAVIHYRINGGTFAPFGLGFNENNVNGVSGDQRWWGEGANVSLTGLGNGTHTLDLFYTAPFNGDSGSATHVENNGTANFSTTVTVIPEPAAALLGCLGMLGLLRRRR